MNKLKEGIERDSKRVSYISSLLCKHDREVLRHTNKQYKQNE